MFNLRKLKAVDGKEKYRVEVSNSFETLEDMDTEMEISIAWKTIRDIIRVSAKGVYRLL
jgi:hypothetical protein